MSSQQDKSPHGANFYVQAAITYGYIIVWVVLSAVVILLNKYLLSYSGFPFPIALTMTHMAFCSLLTWILVKAKVVEVVKLDTSMYIRNVLPIAALFSGTLWLGNAAYIYLSVSFIQMFKAQSPVTVFLVGVLLGTEKYAHGHALNMVVVALGVTIASYGEINFNIFGVLLQSSALVTESFRLVLIQLLLQSRGVRLNAVTTLYYIAPACFAFLSLPFFALELPKILHTQDLVVPYGLLVISAVGAFALNMSIFLLIGRTSALTLNVAGVVKDWMLILLSVLMYKSPVTALQLGGYGLAFLGVCWYNYEKLQAARQAPQPQQQRPADEEKQALLQGERQSAPSQAPR